MEPSKEVEAIAWRAAMRYVEEVDSWGERPLALGRWWEALVWTFEGQNVVARFEWMPYHHGSNRWILGKPTFRWTLSSPPDSSP
jgi:hypothetical protein